MVAPDAECTDVAEVLAVPTDTGTATIGKVGNRSNAGRLPPPADKRSAMGRASSRCNSVATGDPAHVETLSEEEPPPPRGVPDAREESQTLGPDPPCFLRRP